MSEKDFLEEKDKLMASIEHNTKEHWKEYYKDVPIECIFDDLVIDINEIKRLTKENKQLKEVIDEIKCKAEQFDLGKYDYCVPVFEIKEILNKIKENQ